MPTWKSRGLRGSAFEEMLNRTNELYREKGLALVQKVPTPITPIEIDQKSRHITLAYFDQKSTVDYIGACQGIPICFDAKESATETFNLQNIHDHQMQFMTEFAAQGGVAFFLIYFTKLELMYFMPVEEMAVFTKRAKNGGRKSFRRDELKEEHYLFRHPGIMVPYLDMLDKYLSEKE
ncbi:MAG: Holliday junction resolvase RecU [Lachnospiraceae bacterium]|nr:Holliday junction resolvase RecU [Lachnospiraceae bacterium]